LRRRRSGAREKIARFQEDLPHVPEDWNDYQYDAREYYWD
jgi:hypothetical protein